jgi:conjugal transfer/entry exclusion protein
MASKLQKKIIHTLAAKCYLNKQEYRNLLQNLYGTDSSIGLSYEQAKDLIARLQAIVKSIQKANKTP